MGSLLPHLPSPEPMLGAHSPSSTTNAYNPSHQAVSPTSSGLDYETFWQLQRQHGVATLRDNLNHASAQNQTMAAHGMRLEPYKEPMYVYNTFPYVHEHFGQAAEASQLRSQHTDQPGTTEFGTPFKNNEHSTISTTEGGTRLPSSPTFMSSPFVSLNTNPVQSSTSASASAQSPYTPVPQQSRQEPSGSKGRKETNRRGRGRKRKRKSDNLGDSEDESNDRGRIGKGPNGRPVRL
jgi:hypothetical protein